MISVSFKSNKIFRYLVHIIHTLLLSVFSLCNAVGFIFIKVLGFARDHPYLTLPGVLRLFKR